MYGKLFGQFLLERGTITPRQLEQALEHQGQVNTPLGVLAMDQGLMRGEQVESVLEAQRRSTKKFGTLAVEMGFLAPSELADLLRAQARGHLYLGQCLIDQGTVTYVELEKLLEAFHVANRELAAELVGSLEGRPQGPRLQMLAETAQRFFARGVCGAAKVCALEDDPCELGTRGQAVWLVKEPQGERPFLWGFSLERRVLFSFVFCLLGRSTTSEAIIRETLEDFAESVDYALCLELSRQGAGCPSSPVEIGVLPPASRGVRVCLEMATTIGPFTLFYEDL